jgi:hypothetical protein
LQHANQVRKYVLLWVVSFAIVELYNWRQDSSLCSSYASVYQAPMANQQSAAISYQRCQILHSLLQTRLSPYCWWVICGFIYMWCMRRLLWYIWCLWWLFWYIWWLWWILKYIWCLWWILWNAYYACDFGDFYTWKKKKLHRSLCRVKHEAHGKVTKTTSWNRTFALRFCMGAWQRSILCRAFLRGRTAKANSLPCVLFPTHDKPQPTPFATWAPWVIVFAVCRPWRTTKIFRRVCGECARQCEFTVQKSTVRPLPCASIKNASTVRLDKKCTTKALSCVFWLLLCARGARQTPSFP